MSPAILALLIGMGSDLLTTLITRYQTLPETPEATKVRLEALKVSIRNSKAEVEAVEIKDV